MVTLSPSKVWTYEDLFALPADKRYEIIEGELFEMPAPGFDHATVIMNLIGLLLPAVRSVGGVIRTAPLDVFLAGANPVQPDIVVLLEERRHLISARGIEGPPDLVIEVISPSNPEHDLVTKRLLYERANVPEYWSVRTDLRMIQALTLRDGSYESLVRATGETIVFSRVLSGLTFPVSRAFEDVVARPDR